MRARIIKCWPMIFIDLEADVSGVKRILPLLKGLTWPHRTWTSLSPNESTDQGIVTNGNHGTDLEADVSGVKRILPLMKGLTLPDRKRIPLSPNKQ